MYLRYNVEISEFGLAVLKITYPNCETIELDLTHFYKDTSNVTTLYDKINDYVATLPEATQKQIYDVFFKLYSSDYKASYADKEVIVKLEVKIRQVTELLSYNNFKIWLGHQEANLIYPDNIQNDFIYDPDLNTTVEKTYVKRDYTNLIALIIFIRALSPLYIEFFNYIREITPHFYYKVFLLFIRSDVFVCPETEKLRTYIEVNQQTLIGDNRNGHLILDAGLSDDDLLDSLLAEVVFNKLLTIDFFRKKCNIISFIFQTIRYKGSFLPSDGVMIRAKAVATESSREDSSYFEDYRKTSDIPIGTTAEIQHSLSDIHQNLLALGRTDFDFDLYEKELSNISSFLDKKIEDVQAYILGWFMSKIINPRALWYIENRKRIELLLFAKTILLQDGQDFIALLLSSYRHKENTFMNVVIKNTVNKNVIKKLQPYYNFAMEDEKISTLEKTISEISKDVANNLWVPIATQNQISLVGTTQGYLNVPQNLNEVLFDYIEYLHTKLVQKPARV